MQVIPWFQHLLTPVGQFSQQNETEICSVHHKPFFKPFPDPCEASSLFFSFFFFKWANAESSAQLILRMVSACWTVHFSRQTLSTKKISSSKLELLENCSDAALSESCTAECPLTQTAALFRIRRATFENWEKPLGRIWHVWAAVSSCVCLWWCLRGFRFSHNAPFNDFTYRWCKSEISRSQNTDMVICCANIGWFQKKTTPFMHCFKPRSQKPHV